MSKIIIDERLEKQLKQERRQKECDLLWSNYFSMWVKRKSWQACTLSALTNDQLDQELINAKEYDKRQAEEYIKQTSAQQLKVKEYKDETAAEFLKDIKKTREILDKRVIYYRNWLIFTGSIFIICLISTIIQAVQLCAH